MQEETLPERWANPWHIKERRRIDQLSFEVQRNHWFLSRIVEHCSTIATSLHHKPLSRSHFSCSFLAKENQVWPAHHAEWYEAQLWRAKTQNHEADTKHDPSPCDDRPWQQQTESTRRGCWQTEDRPQDWCRQWAVPLELLTWPPSPATVTTNKTISLPFDRTKFPLHMLMLWFLSITPRISKLELFPKPKIFVQTRKKKKVSATFLMLFQGLL